MACEIDGTLYYSLVEAARMVGVSVETFLGWVSGRTPLHGLTLDTTRDAQLNQYFVSADSVRILQHKNQFISAHSEST